MKPKISVIVTLYNYAHYIEDCIESFLDQPFKKAEMIIVDDCSTDNPHSIIKPYLRKYPPGKVRYIQHSKNMNYSHSKNTGIKAARGDILVMLDADDQLSESGLVVRYNKIMEGYDFVHGPSIQFGNVHPCRVDPMWEKWLKTKEPFWVHAQGFALKRDIHKKIGLYDTAFWAQSDREFIYRVFNAGYKIGEVETPVSWYRIHDCQMHKSKKKKKDRPRLDAMMKEVIEKRKRGDFSGLEMLE